MTTRLIGLDSLKSEIADRVTIIDIAESLGLELLPAGSQMKTQCPVHDDNDPSCYISETKANSDLVRADTKNMFGGVAIPAKGLESWRKTIIMEPKVETTACGLQFPAMLSTIAVYVVYHQKHIVGAFATTFTLVPIMIQNSLAQAGVCVCAPFFDLSFALRVFVSSFLPVQTRLASSGFSPARTDAAYTAQPLGEPFTIAFSCSGSTCFPVLISLFFSTGLSAFGVFGPRLASCYRRGGLR